jgi:hypothetical protein
MITIGKGREGTLLRVKKAMKEGIGIRITRNTQDADIHRVPSLTAGRVDVVHHPQKEIAAIADADLIPEITIAITKRKKEDPAQKLTIEELLRRITRRPRNARWIHSLIRDLKILSRGLLRVKPKLKKVPCFLLRQAEFTSLLSSFVR